jgi:hypothetical protein
LGSSSSRKIYQEYAWVVLFALWGLHFALSATNFFPRGNPFPTDPAAASLLSHASVNVGVSGLILAVFGMVVSTTAYRKGERWAWYLSWLQPFGIMVTQLNQYSQTGSITVIVLASVFTFISLVGLFLPFRIFFPRASYSTS